MGVLEEKIEKFLSVGFNYSFGDGSGSGNSDGSGYGSGSGSGVGSGYGIGSGSESGFSSGSGIGEGSGSVDGYGFGCGSGSGFGLKTFNNQKIYLIDDVPTIITHIKGNIAKGKILNDTFETVDCYIAKGQNKFAHGKTIKKAVQDLQKKIFENLDTDEAIKKFKENFELNKKYKGTEFYFWHNVLTGSCEMGRNNFVEEHNLDLEKKYTVQEFIELTENDYGGEIIKRLKQELKENRYGRANY